MRGADWSRAEVEATVSDYFDMFEAELRGEPYNKARHNRRLQGVLEGRSRGAIERKHQNISAVLLELGLPYIPGYKPLGNYQGLLLEVVEDRLAVHTDLVRQVRREVEIETVDVPTVGDILDRLESPPKPKNPKLAARTFERHIRRPKRTVDYLAIEAGNSALGRAGEEFVVNFERARLIHEGKSSLADRVEHVAVTEGDGLGFDVRSFERDGSDRLIEVKTTAWGKETPFYVTANEVVVSAERSSQYHLYRAFRFRRDPRLFTVHGSLERTCRLLPDTFRAMVT